MTDPALIADTEADSGADMCGRYVRPEITVGSLFSGIGGIDLGLERAGMRVIWQSEVDAYASKVLAKHWPNTPNLGDVTKIDWSEVERPDLICGGYPCQPFSSAGRRGGTADDRHLWPYFADALRHLRPRWALLENVPGHLSLGFDRVLADLASLGFDAEWQLLPAAAFGAPHLRYRLFVVADAKSQCHPEQSEGSDSEALLGAGPGASSRSGSRCPAEGTGVVGRVAAHGEADVADADEVGRGGWPRVFRPRWWAESQNSRLGHADGSSSNPLAAASGSWGSVGESSWWAVEPDVGRVAHGIPRRVDRLRCLGNAVVPQVAEYVGRLIMETANA